MVTRLYPRGTASASAGLIALHVDGGYSAPMPTLGARIRKARKDKGLSQSELGRRLGVASQTINQWEHDKKQPRRDNLLRLVQQTGVPIAWLLYGNAGLYEQDENATLGVNIVGGRRVALLQIEQAARLERPDDHTSFVIAHFPCGPGALAFVLPDDSNAPDHPVGSHWVIDPDESPQPGDMVLAWYGAPSRRRPVYGEYRLEGLATGDVAIVAPLNSRWPSARSDIAPLQVIGVMTESARPGRKR